MKTISLKLPDGVAARLEACARATGKTKSALTREALTSVLEGEAELGSCVDLVRDLIGSAEGPRDLASGRKHLRRYGQ